MKTESLTLVFFFFKKFIFFKQASKLLLSYLIFLVESMENFQTNSDIKSIIIDTDINLHVPNTKLNKYKK
jgi:hypothetical protein